MAFDVFSDTMDRRRATRLLLLAIIVLALPCYCVGFVLLAYAPANEPESTKVPTNATLGGMTSTPFYTPSYTPFGLTATSTQGGSPLLPTPGQLFLPTNTPFVWPTATLTLTPPPQPTNMPSLTPAPTLTPSPTLVPTKAPTLTPAPTNTPLPTETPTDVPTDVPTEAPPPTDVPLPTEAPLPTPTQEQLNNQNTEFWHVEDLSLWI
jgi:type VI secretion system secreted protein VgrG